MADASTERSKTGLMLVDNPKRFFTAICQLRNRTFTRNTYRDVLASLTERGTVDEKTRDTYFYSASIFNLIARTDNPHEYRTTLAAAKICQTLNNPDRLSEYQTLVRGLVLTNPTKGKLFQDFLNFLSRRRTRTEIVLEFREVPSKTLIAFGLEAGMIVEHGGLYHKAREARMVDQQEFYHVLVDVYSELRNSERKSWVYIPIDTLRQTVSVEMGLGSINAFDQLLEKTMDGPSGRDIFLHGAPPQLEHEFSGFTYKGKRYAYLSMRTAP